MQGERTIYWTRCDCCKTEVDYSDAMTEELNNVHICDDCLEKGWVILSDINVDHQKVEKNQLPKWFFIHWDEETNDYDYSKIIPITHYIPPPKRLGIY